MDIYLVPVTPARFELYSEQADGGLNDEPGAPTSGVLARARARFAEMLLAAADRERAKREGRLTEPTDTVTRLRDRLTGWVAERVAEQRLHWSLRRIERAVLVHPATMSGESAMVVVRQALAHDRRWHTRRAVVHGVLFVVAGALAVVPGPNLVAYYFAFRLVGHWLSMRGAAQGLTRVTWETRPSEPLSELAAALTERRARRRKRIQEIAARLELPELAAFVERVRLRRA